MKRTWILLLALNYIVVLELNAQTEFESITVLNRKDLNANVFVSIDALEEDFMVKQAIGLVSMLKSENYTNVSAKLLVVESSAHGSACPWRQYAVCIGYQT